MVNKNMKFIIGLILIIIGTVIYFLSNILYPFSYRVIEEKPCVDGNGNINLNGIMCEDVSIFIGDIEIGEDSSFSLITVLCGLVITGIGMYGIITPYIDNWFDERVCAI